MIYTYFDAQLTQRMNDDLEARAIADIASMGYTSTTTGLSAYLYQQLVIYRAYIICATENATEKDDVYSQKIKQYKAEFDAVQEQAKTAVLSANATTARSNKSIVYGRG